MLFVKFFLIIFLVSIFIKTRKTVFISMKTGSVRLKEIAIRTGFTINTVSRALKNKDDISQKTQKLIQDVAKEIGYINNSVAGALRSGFTKIIAVILGDISNPHFAIMAKEIECAASKFQYTTIIINTNENEAIEKQAIYSALSKKVDGIILCPCQKSAENINFLKRTATPFVLIGRRVRDPHVDFVIVNDAKGGYLATQHLIKRGHKNILLLNGPKYISSARERGAGYKKALRDNAIPLSNDLIREIVVTGEDLQHFVNKIIDEGTRFSAIFAFSDLIAWETIFALNNRGLKVPEDVAIVGFDDIQSRLFFPIPLTTIGSINGRMSETAVKMLMTKIQSKKKIPACNAVVDVDLVVRNTA
jgi:LacI family transcriptional regulator